MLECDKHLGYDDRLEQGWGSEDWQGQVAGLNRIVRDGFIKRVRIEQRLNEGEEWVSQACI